MKLEVLKYLADMDISLKQLMEYKFKLTELEDLTANIMLKDAIERRLSIIGEALYQANKMDKDLSITNKKKIMGFAAYTRA